jgi:hypothetical protein
VANVAGVDGLVYSTLGFLVVAGGALLVLRRVEHEILPHLSPTHRAAHDVFSNPPK